MGVLIVLIRVVEMAIIVLIRIKLGIIVMVTIIKKYS